MTKRAKDSEVVHPREEADDGDGHLDADQLDLSSSDEEDSEEEAGALEVESGDDEPESADADEEDDEDEEDGDEQASSDDEVGRTVLDLIQGRGAGPGGGGEDAQEAQDREDRTADAEPAHDPGSDSSEDERPSRNTGAAAAAAHPSQLSPAAMHACAFVVPLHMRQRALVDSRCCKLTLHAAGTAAGRGNVISNF